QAAPAHVSPLPWGPALPSLPWPSPLVLLFQVQSHLGHLLPAGRSRLHGERRLLLRGLQLLGRVRMLADGLRLLLRARVAVAPGRRAAPCRPWSRRAAARPPGTRCARRCAARHRTERRSTC